MEDKLEAIYKKAAALPIGDRVTLIERLSESVNRYEEDIPVADRYRFLLTLAETALGRKLTSKRTNGDTTIRMFVAYRMRQEGYHYAEIGRAMKRSHATIINLVRGMDNVFELPLYYAYEKARYEEFEKMIPETTNKSNSND